MEDLMSESSSVEQEECIPTESFITILEQSEFDLYEKKECLIELKNASVAGLSKLIEEIPDIAARKGTSGLYKLDMKGLKGSLMQLKSGGNTTSVVNAQGTITGTAAISQVGTTASQVVANIMNVASFATGMYYMGVITNCLENTERLVNGVMQFLNNDKKAEMLSIYSGLKRCYEDFQYCMIDTELDENLINSNRMQLSNIDKPLEKIIDFYLLQLQCNNDSFKNRDKAKVVNEVVADFCNNVGMLKQLYDLYCIKIILEINYNYVDSARKINDAYIESRKKLVLDKFEFINETLQKQTEIKTYLKNEKLPLFEIIKKSQLLDAMVKTYGGDFKYIFSMEKSIIGVIKNAIENYKTQKTIDSTEEFYKIEDLVGGFEIEEPKKYVEMIDNFTMLSASTPDLILNDGKVYILQN